MYAQRTIEHYRGYIKIFTKKFVKKPLDPVDKKAKKAQTPNYQMVEEDVMVCQLLISIPKKKLIASKPLKGTSFNKEILGKYKLTSIRNIQWILDKYIILFSKIAESLDSSWRELGSVLKVPESRLQMIKHNYAGSQTSKLSFQILMFWFKGLELMENKVNNIGNINYFIFIYRKKY